MGIYTGTMPAVFYRDLGTGAMRGVNLVSCVEDGGRLVLEIQPFPQHQLFAPTEALKFHLALDGRLHCPPGVTLKDAIHAELKQLDDKVKELDNPGSRLWLWFVYLPHFVKGWLAGYRDTRELIRRRKEMEKDNAQS